MDQQQKLLAALVQANVLSADARPDFAKACVDALLALGVRVTEEGLDVERLRAWLGEHAVRADRLGFGATVIDAEELGAYLDKKKETP